MDKKINDYVLKLTGKVSTLEPLEISHNFKVVIEGAVTEEKTVDNNDGTYNIEYRFIPVKVEAIDGIGKTIRTKDPRSFSQKVRAWIYKHWENKTEISTPHEEYYEKFMKWLISNLAFLLEKFDKEHDQL